MTDDSFYLMKYFTMEMFEAANAVLSGMQLEAVHRLDNFAVLMQDEGYRVELLRNGCNTGDHRSPEHAAGKAIDFTIIPEPVITRVVFGLAFEGFRAIGVYLNYKGYYSFHADTVRYRQWAQFIDKNGKRVQYPLLNNLKDCLK